MSNDNARPFGGYSVTRVKSTILFKSVADYEAFKEAYSDVINILTSDSYQCLPTPREFIEGKAEPSGTAQADRPSFDALFIEIAGIVAIRGTCPRLKVGSVITVDNRIIATGYNGSPAGLPHCSEVGCLQGPCPACGGKGRVMANTSWGVHERPCEICQGTRVSGGCKRTTHAEANALIQCARSGSSPVGGTLYVTHRPCSACAGLIITAGITRVMYREAYRTDGLGDEVLDMFGNARVSLERYPYETL